MQQLNNVQVRHDGMDVATCCVAKSHRQPLDCLLPCSLHGDGMTEALFVCDLQLLRKYETSLISIASDKAMHTMTAEDRIAGLVTWADNNDLYAPSLQTGHVNGMRGLIVTKQIKKGGLLLSIPRAMTLSVHEGAPCPFPKFMGDAEWNTFPE